MHVNVSNKCFKKLIFSSRMVWLETANVDQYFSKYHHAVVFRVGSKAEI